MSAPPMLAEVPPFIDVIEIRKRIDDIEARMSKIDTTKILLLTEMVEAVGLWRSGQCKLNSGNVCSGWRLSQDLANKIVSFAGPDAVVQQDNVFRLNLAKLFFVCAFCPIYTPKT